MLTLPLIRKIFSVLNTHPDYCNGNSTDFHSKNVLIFMQKIGSIICNF